MKIIIGALICLGFASARQVPEVQDLIGDAIKKAVLEFIKTLPDPVRVSNVTITIPTNDYVSGEIHINSASAVGLSKAEVRQMKVNELTQTLTGEIKFPVLAGAGSGHPKIINKNSSETYDQKVSAAVTLGTLDINFSVQYDISSGNIKNLNIKPKLRAAIFELSGIYKDDTKTEKLTEELNKNFTNWFNSDTTVFPEISTVLEKIVNDYLDAHKKKSVHY